MALHSRSEQEHLPLALNISLGSFLSVKSHFHSPKHSGRGSPETELLLVSVQPSVFSPTSSALLQHVRDYLIYFKTAVQWKLLEEEFGG